MGSGVHDCKHRAEHFIVRQNESEFQQPKLGGVMKDMGKEWQRKIKEQERLN